MFAAELEVYEKKSKGTEERKSNTSYLRAEVPPYNLLFYVNTVNATVETSKHIFSKSNKKKT